MKNDLQSEWEVKPADAPQQDEVVIFQAVAPNGPEVLLVRKNLTVRPNRLPNAQQSNHDPPGPGD
jgi:hypothetical protein